MNTDLTKEQKDYAVFLPALSGFYATFVGKQRFEEYVDYNRIPYANGMESINWLNRKDGLFQYHWTRTRTFNLILTKKHLKKI